MTEFDRFRHDERPTRALDPGIYTIIALAMVVALMVAIIAFGGPGVP
jgi:hypothetical protein